MTETPGEATAVVDASCLVQLALVQRGHERFQALHEALVEAGVQLVAPTLVEFELGQALARNARAPPHELAAVLEDLLSAVKLQNAPARVTFELAAGLSYYDASYLALAQTTGSPLCTYDQKLARTAMKTLGHDRVLGPEAFHQAALPGPSGKTLVQELSRHESLDAATLRRLLTEYLPADGKDKR